MEIDRRTFLGWSGISGAAASPVISAILASAAHGADVVVKVGESPYGPLQPKDANGFRLPSGFTSKVIARSGQKVDGTDYTWHLFPDGAAVFPQPDGGWVYVSNSEVPSEGKGGAGALRFDAEGNVIDAYSILTGTTLNCAGGVTLEGTWLSCEEVERGRVFECSVDGKTPAKEIKAYGRFPHEAAAVDPTNGIVYLTEDRPDGRFYRVTKDQALQAAKVASDGTVSWLDVPDPSAADTPTRQQVPETTAFAGGEGIWYHAGSKLIYFVTKGDNKVWHYDGERIAVYHDPAKVPGSPISTVDNIAMNATGDLLICEDQNEEQQLVVISAAGVVSVLAQLDGHAGSELAGVAFAPHGKSLYISSQRGGDGSGMTYEVSGPFIDPAAVPTTTTTVGSSTPTTTPTKSGDDDDDSAVLPIVGGGALVVAIGGAALLKLRNRRPQSD